MKLYWTSKTSQNNAWSWIWGKTFIKFETSTRTICFSFPRAIPIPELCAATDTSFFFFFNVTQITRHSWILVHSTCTVTHLLLAYRCTGRCCKVAESCFYYINYRLIDATLSESFPTMGTASEQPLHCEQRIWKTSFWCWIKYIERKMSRDWIFHRTYL